MYVSIRRAVGWSGLLVTTNTFYKVKMSLVYL